MINYSKLVYIHRFCKRRFMIISLSRSLSSSLSNSRMRRELTHTANKTQRRNTATSLEFMVTQNLKNKVDSYMEEKENVIKTLVVSSAIVPQ